MHKKTFALESGACLSGESYRVAVFPVRIEVLKTVDGSQILLN